VAENEKEVVVKGKETGTRIVDGLHVEAFQYLPSIGELIREADLVISHAGSGTVLETLGAGRRLITVINESLMDNHQTELAYQMCKDRHLLYCTVDTLGETIERIQTAELVPYVKGDPEKFARFLDRIVGSETR
jgi:beta-1,4-N-acetylglucosaminyltransferase